MITGASIICVGTFESQSIYALDLIEMNLSALYCFILSVRPSVCLSRTW